MEQQAHASALAQVASMLERVDQLEKIGQLKQRVIRKQNSVEATLKSAIQSQLGDAQLGLSQLHSALNYIHESRESLQEIQQLLQTVPAMVPRFSELSDVSQLHQMYSAAVSTMDFTLTIGKFVERAQKVIDQGSLLAAHKYLIELQHTRDGLLKKLLRKLGGDSEQLERVQSQFSEVEELSDRLGKRLWLDLGRTLTTVRREPHQIVTALRIIEREEQADAEALQGAEKGGYMPPGRPKRWRQKAMQVLEDAVTTRIDANAFEGREDNKLWLARHLEVCRLLVLEDLRVVKRQCVVCFPPHYDIFNTYVSMYHTALSKHLMETIAGGLVGNEYFSLLSWTRNTYPGVELLAHPDLAVDTTSLSPLLDQETVQKLVNEYLQGIESNYCEWLQKALDQEGDDWGRAEEPEADDEQYQTAMPLIVFQMVDQNLQVANSISEDFALQLLSVSLSQITSFSKLYRAAVLKYKTGHFADRSQLQYFTHYMIAIVNNCEAIIALAEQTKTRYFTSTTDDHNVEEALVTLTTTFRSLRGECIGWLLEELWLDLDSHFGCLFSRQWLSSAEPMNTICATVEDYCCDYVHLRQPCFEAVIADLSHQLDVRYFSAAFQRRIALKSVEERRDCGSKMVADVGQIKHVLSRFLSDQESSDSSSVAVINSMAEVVRADDPELLTFELHRLLRMCPDATSDHLTSLLLLRGDLGRLEVRQRVQELLESVGKQDSSPSILSEVQVQSSVFSI